MIAENIRKWPEQLRAEGIEQGYQQAQAEVDQERQQRLEAEKRLQDTAKNLLAMNMMTDDQIAQATGLDVQVIQDLRQSMTQH